MWSPKISSWDFCAIKKHQGATTKISSSSLLPHLKTSTPCFNVISNNIDMRLLRNQKSPEQNTKNMDIVATSPKTATIWHLNLCRHQTSVQKHEIPQSTSQTSTSIFMSYPKNIITTLLRSPKIQSYLHIPSPISLFVWIAIEHVKSKNIKKLSVFVPLPYFISIARNLLSPYKSRRVFLIKLHPYG